MLGWAKSCLNLNCRGKGFLSNKNSGGICLGDPCCKREYSEKCPEEKEAEKNEALEQ